jgi:type I restriction enzyme S subunit
MSKVKFGDIVKDVKINVDRDNNPYEFYVAGDHMDSEDLYIRRRGRFATDDVGPAFTRIFKPGQVLYGSRRTYLKKVAVADFEGICANTTFVFETKDSMVFEQRLLPFLMLSEGFTNWSVSHSKGSTNPYVLFSDLASYEFDLPSLKEQKVLAEKLWAAYEVKQSYLKMIDATQEMVKAQFIEMFGDVYHPLSGTDVYTLQEMIDIQMIIYHLDGNHGGDYPRANEFVSKGIPYISANCIINNQIIWDKAKYLTKQRANMLRKGIARDGDVLFAHNATVGPTALLKTQFPKVLLGTSLTAYRCDTKYILPEYLHAYMSSYIFVNQYINSMKQSTRNQIPISAQRKLLFMMPSLKQQQKFASIYQQADKSTSELRKSIDAIDKVIKSLINENL